MDEHTQVVLLDVMIARCIDGDTLPDEFLRMAAVLTKRNMNDVIGKWWDAQLKKYPELSELVRAPFHKGIQRAKDMIVNNAKCTDSVMYWLLNVSVPDPECMQIYTSTGILIDMLSNEQLMAKHGMNMLRVLIRYAHATGYSKHGSNTNMLARDPNVPRIVGQALRTLREFHSRTQIAAVFKKCRAVKIISLDHFDVPDKDLAFYLI